MPRESLTVTDSRHPLNAPIGSLFTGARSDCRYISYRGRMGSIRLFNLATRRTSGGGSLLLSPHSGSLTHVERDRFTTFLQREGLYEDHLHLFIRGLPTYDEVHMVAETTPTAKSLNKLKEWRLKCA